MAKYYFPINSVSLSDYLACACIKPSKYFEKRHGDLQDKFPEALLLTTHFGSRETDCCLEVGLTENEEKQLLPIEREWFLYVIPIPITRIKKILFTSEEQKSQTITNIRMSAAFVPDELIEVIDEFNNIPLEKTEVTINRGNAFEEPIKKFDSYLGGFSLMRLACEEYMNYSKNYFSTLSFFSEKIRKELESNKQNVSDRYFDAFVGEKKFKELLPLINRKIDEQDLNILAKEEGQKILKNNITGSIDLSNLKGKTQTAAILYTHKVGNESGDKKIDSLILNNFKGVEYGELIALCYGLNRGYSAFGHKYKDKIVKFQLNSQLDYYTIESLYQYAFNGIKSNEFPYLDSWCPKQKSSNIIGSKTDYKILDIIVVGKKKAKVLSEEYWEKSLSSFFQSDNFYKKTLSHIFQELVEAVFNDSKEEIADCYENQLAQKQSEIENLKAEKDKLEKQINIKEFKLEKKELGHVNAEQHMGDVLNQNIETLHLLFKDSDKFKTKTELKNSAKQIGLKLPNDCSLRKIVELLIFADKPNEIFNE